LGVEDLELLSAEELHTPDSFLVILNGLILGKHRKPLVFVLSFIKCIIFKEIQYMILFLLCVVNITIFFSSVLLMQLENCGELVKLASL